MREWLPKIDATTSLEDVVTRPSAFNPYPEYTNGGVAVAWPSLSTSLYGIRYIRMQAGCYVPLPVDHEIPAQRAKRPRLIQGSTTQGNWQAADIAREDGWIPLEDFWRSLSVDLATNYLFEEGCQKGAAKKLADLMVANTVTPELATPEPRSFVRQVIAAVHDEIQAGQPAVGYALATYMFQGFGGTLDGRRVNSLGTHRWATASMPQLLFPQLASQQRRIGQDITHLVTETLKVPAIEAWLTGLDAPEPACEKVGLLLENRQQKIARLEAELSGRLEQSAQVAARNGVRWRAPRPLAEYAINKLVEVD